MEISHRRKLQVQARNGQKDAVTFRSNACIGTFDGCMTFLILFPDHDVKCDNHSLCKHVHLLWFDKEPGVSCAQQSGSYLILIMLLDVDDLLDNLLAIRPCVGDFAAHPPCPRLSLQLLLRSSCMQADGSCTIYVGMPASTLRTAACLLGMPVYGSYKAAAYVH